MKSIHTYFEELATPANTMGMGNPGETVPGELTEPIGKAYSEVEKDKKKKKRRIKSLAESLFDKDLTKQGVYIGDIYELDTWSIPSNGKEYLFTEDIINYGIKGTVGTVLGKPRWKKILKPLRTFPEVDVKKCWYANFLRYVTELILCCESIDQIIEVVKGYIMDCRNDPSKYKFPGDRAFVKDHVFKDVDVTAFGIRDELLRIVTIKFIMENGDFYVMCVTFKKRDL